MNRERRDLRCDDVEGEHAIKGAEHCRRIEFCNQDIDEQSRDGDQGEAGGVPNEPMSGDLSKREEASWQAHWGHPVYEDVRDIATVQVGARRPAISVLNPSARKKAACCFA